MPVLIEGGKGRVHKVDKIDAILAINRQQIILLMIENGQLDAETGMELFQSTVGPDQVIAEREALEKGKLGEPGTPSGVLGTLLFKLKRSKEDES